MIYIQAQYQSLEYYKHIKQYAKMYTVFSIHKVKFYLKLKFFYFLLFKDDIIIMEGKYESCNNRKCEKI